MDCPNAVEEAEDHQGLAEVQSVLAAGHARDLALTQILLRAAPGGLVLSGCRHLALAPVPRLLLVLVHLSLIHI